MATCDEPPPGYLQTSNQESLILECSVCAENYGPDFDHQSRSLRCGHTFCTKCLMKIMTSRGVRCPMCNHPHHLSSPDVMLLPINYAVQEILKTVSANKTLVEEQQPDLPPCGVCRSPATVICVDCDPGKHFHFCEKCDNDEHGRPFGPVQRHKRFPRDKAPCPSSYAGCPRHPTITVSFFSENLNEFACNMCISDEDWVSRCPHFELIVEATKRLQGKVQKLNKYTTDVIKRMNESKQMLETILSNLEPASMEVKADITTRFSKLIEALQDRQRILLANVEVELKNRRENVETQLKSVVTSTAKYRDIFESLNSLISQTDIELLRSFPTTTQHIESILDGEDKSLLRPVINQNIPFYINKDIEKEVMTLGAVGGGFTPSDLESSPSGSQGSLMELFWQLPEHCGKLSRFQIEYDQISMERRSSGMVMESDDLVYSQSEPQFCEVPGNKLNTFMDYLCPGYNYQFRIRSANDAGWGMWSKPIVGKCEGFPFTLEYTKSIHRVVVPTSSYYRITVKGAKAEDGMVRHGGKGAIISAIFSLKAGDVLILLCGGMSSRHHYHSGGGGGSFVALNEISQSTLLIAAGGGGGTRGTSEEDWDGSDASIYPDGRDGLGEDAGKGGVNGGPGEDSRDKASEGPSFGNGGAGFMQDSLTAMSFLSGGHGGQNGGFGGGGAVGMYGGGGGGGYSGGGGGRGGGGGGSYVISTALDVNREVGNDKHGCITIDKVMPPYPLSNPHLSQGCAVGEVTPTSDSSTEVSSVSQPTNLYSQISSSSVGSGGVLTSSLSSKAISTGSVGTSIGTIPESAQESPASTSQVMDHARHVPTTVTFTVGPDSNGNNGNDDVTIDLFTHGGTDSGGGGNTSTLVPSEVDAPGPQVTRMPASAISEFLPTLEEYFGSSQQPTTVAFTTIASTGGGGYASVATTTPALVKVSEVATMVPTYPLGSYSDSRPNVKDLIEFHQSLGETPDYSSLTNKVSPEEKAIIAQQFQQPGQVNQSPSQASLLLSEGHVNSNSVTPSKSVMLTADSAALSQQIMKYQQQQHLQQQQQQLVGINTPSSMPSDQSATSQWLIQQQLDQELHQQKLVEAQRYLQSHHHQQQQQQQQQQQASQQVHQQLVVMGGGQEDLSPPLTQQHQYVAMHHPAPQQQSHQPLVKQVGSSQGDQSVAQQQLHHQQQQQPVQQQQLQTQGGGIRGNHSPPLLTPQHVVVASQPGSQPPSNCVEHTDPGQYGQQPSFDYIAHQNWKSNN